MNSEQKNSNVINNGCENINETTETEADHYKVPPEPESARAVEDICAEIVEFGRRFKMGA